MSCTDIAKYFPHFPICRGTVLAVPRHFCFGTFCPKVKARSVSTGPQPAGFGEAPQQVFWQAFLPPDGAKISSVFTLELLAKNASVATLALLAVSAFPGKPTEKRRRCHRLGSFSPLFRRIILWYNLKYRVVRKTLV